MRSPERRDGVERDVRHDETGRRQRARRARRDGSRRPRRRSRAAFARVDSTAGSSRSTPVTGPKPSFAAAIERTPEPQPTSSRLVRGRSSSSSRQSRVVGCAPVPKARPGSTTTASASAGGELPRRPDPQRADPNRAVELAPAVLPAGFDLDRVARRESAEDTLAGIPVGGQLELAGMLDLLEAFRGELEEPRAKLLGRLRRDSDRGADQRNALFSFSKKPSSARYVSSSLSRSNSWSSRCCSSVSRRGTVTLTRTRWSPRPKPWSTGIPWPRRTRTWPGCVPGSNSSSTGPSRVSTRDRSRRARPARS